jgi:hypothetical protein
MGSDVQPLCLVPLKLQVKIPPPQTAYTNTFFFKIFNPSGEILSVVNIIMSEPFYLGPFCHTVD